MGAERADGLACSSYDLESHGAPTALVAPRLNQFEEGVSGPVVRDLLSRLAELGPCKIAARPFREASEWGLASLDGLCKTRAHN